MNDAFGHPQRIVVLGGTSDIAAGILERLVDDTVASVVVAGRDPDRLAEVADAQLARGARRAPVVRFDAAVPADASRTVDAAFAAAQGDVDLVLVAVGTLGDQAVDERCAGGTADVVTVAFTWPAAALAALSVRLRAQGSGRIVVVTSVAGVRVRRANYVYGSAKAGLDAYALGLAEALRGSGVTLQIVRPGFVHTKMTAGRTAAPFATSTARVGDAVVGGLESGRAVIWVPSILRPVFAILSLLPRPLWRWLPG